MSTYKGYERPIDQPYSNGEVLSATLSTYGPESDAGQAAVNAFLNSSRDQVIQFGDKILKYKDVTSPTEPQARIDTTSSSNTIPVTSPTSTPTQTTTRLNQSSNSGLGLGSFAVLGVLGFVAISFLSSKGKKSKR
jgi:hypothetical protein